MSYKFRVSAASMNYWKHTNDFPYMDALKPYNIRYEPENEEVVENRLVENRRPIIARTDYVIELNDIEDLLNLTNTIDDIIITKDGRLVIYDDYIE